MIIRITGFLMLDRLKMTKTLGQFELVKKNLVEWYGRGMKLNGVTDMEIKFGIHFISHKIYSSNQLNNVICEVVDLAFKVFKNNLSFDLTELQLN